VVVVVVVVVVVIVFSTFFSSNISLREEPGLSDLLNVLFLEAWVVKNRPGSRNKKVAIFRKKDFMRASK
jgi:hypothetical protein